jgi:hypothetical protein
MKKGFTLIATVFIILVVTLLAITTSTLVSSDAVVAVKNYHSLDAFYIASTGVEYYLKQLEGDTDWTTPPTKESKAFSGGYFSITTTNESKNRITYISTGMVTIGATTYRRGIQSTIQRTGGGLSAILGEFVLYWGGGEGTGSTIGNNANITGDIYVGSDLDIGNNVDIDGDTYASGEVSTGTNFDSTGTVESGAEPPFETPTLETTFYDSQIAIAAGQPAGNWTFTNTTLVNQTKYVHGNVMVNNNGNIYVTGTATIVATGKVTLTNNVDVDDYLTVIAGGDIDIANNVNIGKHGLWYSSTYIELGNNAEVGEVNVGEGTQFITPGDIWFGNNADFYGFIYCGGDFVQTGNNFHFEGNMIVGGDIDIDNNATITLNPDLVDVADIIGVTAGEEGAQNIDLTGWDEVY